MGAYQSGELDSSQQSALEACSPGARISIIGAPGTGKTSVLESLMMREMGGSRPRIAVITQDRRAASLLRNDVALAAGGLGDTVSVRTLAAFSFSIVQSYAQAVGRRDPELIAGPDEDSLIAEIIADPAAAIPFPEYVTDEIRQLPAFRAEIRNLITRARELDYSPNDLERLALERDEPMWLAGAGVMRLYDHITESQAAFSGPMTDADRLDHAQLVGAAAHILLGWEENVEAAESGSLGFAKPVWDWVLVDDIQNAPRSILSLLRALSRDGAAIVTTGNPDAAVQGFRGGVASLPGDILRPEPFGLDASPFYLDTIYRGGEGQQAIAGRVAAHIRVGGTVARHRSGRPANTSDVIRGQRFVHQEEELAGIARHMRRLHLTEGVPYSDMAVITRSRGSHEALRRSLVRLGIPVEQIGSDLPLREQPAVASLVAIIRLALGLGDSSQELAAEENPDQSARERAERLRSVLLSLLIGIDPLTLSRMERSLRGYELARGGHRHVSELLLLVLESADALSDFAPSGVESLVRAARIFEAVRTAAKRHQRQAEQVVWGAWDACHRADEWRLRSLKGGVEGDSADANLDAIIQLQRVAQRMADRDPAVAIEVFLAEISSQELPEDSIARAGAAVDAISLTTPSASLGRSWEHVIVAGLQDKVWPNLTLRDTYTHTSRLTQIATGRELAVADPALVRREAFEDVLDDELRQLLHAVTRANSSLLVTCVDNEQEQPSRFIRAMGFVMEEDAAPNLVGQGGQGGDLSGKTVAGSPAPVMSLPAPSQGDLNIVTVIGELRRAAQSEEYGAESKQLLDVLQQAGIPAAQRQRWFDAKVPVNQETEREFSVSVSPSSVENLLACPLRGFLSGMGGERKDGGEAASIGTLIHSLAERFPDGGEAVLLEAFEDEWNATFGDPRSSTVARIGYENARQLVMNLAEYLHRLPPATMTEQRVSVPFDDRVTLNATIDRIHVDEENKAHVFDFKTGSRITVKESADHPQMQLYQWALTKLYEMGSPQGYQTESAELIYLRYPWSSRESSRRIQPALTEQSRARAEQRIRVAASVLCGKDFPARPSEQTCRLCQFATSCPAQPQGEMFS